MKRRDFLRGAGGLAGGAVTAGAASSPVTAQDGESVTVEVGPNNEFVYTPGTDKPLQIDPGTTVKWVWKSDTHNIVVDSQPDGANWQGHETIENTGFEYEFTFETEGEYRYYCQPHRALGMEATIIVGDAGSAGGGGGGSGGGGDGGGGAEEVDPEEMGVPFQAHYVGVAAVLGVLVSLVFTFYALKYGESPNTASPGRK